jgi:large subunit ribosomal protein L9
MKIILQKDVKNVGKVGDVVNVKDGFARNFLFPRKLAQVAKEKSVKAWEHIKQVSEQKKKKAMGERKELLAKLSAVSITFKVQAGEAGKIYGSITAHDISAELEKLGHQVDRRDIQTEPIKQLGQHKVVVSFGQDLKTEITIAVDRQ